jgi:hypothetical protein
MGSPRKVGLNDQFHRARPNIWTADEMQVETVRAPRVATYALAVGPSFDWCHAAQPLVTVAIR